MLVALLATALVLLAPPGKPPTDTSPIAGPPTNTSPTTASSTASPSASSSAPLREIVYKVDQTEIVSGSGSDYYGTSSGMDTGGDEGTLTVDVLRIEKGNLIGVRATENWHSRGAISYSATGYVGPDGTLSIVDGTYSYSMISVLPFLSTGYIVSHDLSLGTGWSVSTDTQQKEHIDRHYSITNVDGDKNTITITIDGTMKGGGMGMFPATEKDTIIYKPGLLVAISGRFEARSISSSATESRNTTHRFHFQLVSDTRDPKP